MVLVLLYTFVSVFIACVAGLAVLGLRDTLSDSRPTRHDLDGLAYSVRAAFDPSDTRTGRVRLLLAAMAHREADAAGAQREQRGLHRATP